MRRYLLSCFIFFVLLALGGAYLLNRYWIHRYDDLIARQASIYRLDEQLVWSVIYEETYFRAWQIGAADEVGLMQVTPTVAREWAKETGFREFEKQTAENVVEFLREPERNIQIGCWYLEKMRGNYRGYSAERAMMLAAYNAGASRVEEWSRSSSNSGTNAPQISEREFIERIGISSTKSYVSSILERYEKVKNKL
jgi:soluble lytic murein transglycosylase